MSETESEFVQPTQSKTQTIIQHGKTGYDLVHGFFTHMGVQGIITLTFMLLLDALLGWVLHPGILILGFFWGGMLGWLLFPHAAWNWRITTDLSNRVIKIERIPVEESKEYLDEHKAKRYFSDEDYRTVTVVGDHVPLSNAHTISDLDYLADTETLTRALVELPPIMKEYAVLKAHRGLEVSTLSVTSTEEAMKVKAPIRSDDIRGVKDDLLETVDNETQVCDT